MGRGSNGLMPELIADPDAMEEDASLAGRYTAAFARRGAQTFIANLTSRVMLLRHGSLRLPVTVDDGGHGRSYVASPHSAYVLYAEEEMDLVGMKRGRTAAKLALTALDGLLRAVRINRAVHLDNWMLSTNLHGDWQGEALPDMRQCLANRFPDHFLVVRTLDEWSCPGLLTAAREDGWILVPARQIWIVEDLERDWRPRNAYGNDRRALAASGLTVEDAGPFGLPDLARVAELYRMLYVGRYSALNPVFTEQFIALTQQSGMLHYRVARDGNGRIMCVGGIWARGDVMTPPIVGYDTSRPQSEALYRIACFLFSQWGMEHGLALHGSAGAAHFKRLRGARGAIEYLAVHADHLSLARRATVRMLAAGLETHMVPMMKREGW